MVSCKQCQTPNSLDSAFCRKCGTILGEQELVEAQAKLEKLVEEGNALFNQGRTDEALAIAEATVLSNPSSTSALSLKTLCHERRGEIAEALESAERLVELNPDSDFDKIRRNTLRQKLQSDLHVAPAPDRRLAVIGATAAFVLVLSLGAFVARLNAGRPEALPLAKNDPTPTTVNPAPQANVAPVNQAASTPTNQTAPPQNGGYVEKPQTQDDAPGANIESSTRERSPGSSVHLPKFSGEGALPEAEGNGGVTPTSPLQVDVSKINEAGAKSASVTRTAAADPNDPKAVGPAQPTPVANAPKEDTGTIEIKTHAGTGRRGGSEPVSGNGLEALLRVGSQQYQLGNYAAAAKSYEQALHNGGDSIILNKRLGQAYSNLGRSSDAAEAYRRCISAVDAALATGRGNRDSLSNTREVCNQALKVLGG